MELIKHSIFNSAMGWLKTLEIMVLKINEEEYLLIEIANSKLTGKVCNEYNYFEEFTKSILGHKAALAAMDIIYNEIELK